jgi:hypothetical protein
MSDPNPHSGESWIRIRIQLMRIQHPAKKSVTNICIYYSPSGVQLKSVGEAREYLETAGTCKCGLECPLLVHKIFDFATQVLHRYRTSGSRVPKDGGHLQMRARVPPPSPQDLRLCFSGTVYCRYRTSGVHGRGSGLGYSIS